MTIRDRLIKKVSEDLELPEDMVYKAITFQGEDANKQTRLVHEIEFSGFGKFILSQSKVKKRIAKTLKAMENERAKENPNEEKLLFQQSVIDQLNKMIR